MIRWARWKTKHEFFDAGDAVEAVYRVLTLLCIGLGVAILTGGSTRFPFPTYQPLLDITGGHVSPWGVSVLAAGGLMFAPHYRAQLAGLGIALLWMNMFSAMFIVAYVKYPQAGSTAPIPYLGLGMIIVAVMTYRVVEHKVAKHQRREE